MWQYLLEDVKPGAYWPLERKSKLPKTRDLSKVDQHSTFSVGIIFCKNLQIQQVWYFKNSDMDNHHFQKCKIVKLLPLQIGERSCTIEILPLDEQKCRLVGIQRWYSIKFIGIRKLKSPLVKIYCKSLQKKNGKTKDLLLDTCAFEQVSEHWR